MWSSRRRSRGGSTSELCSGGEAIGSCLITIGSRVGLQNVPHRSLLLLISSFFYSLPSFLVSSSRSNIPDAAWASELSIAWVTIDFSSLCSLVGCLTQEFSDTQGFVVALWSFSTSSVHPSYPYITKMSYCFRCQDAPWTLSVLVAVWNPTAVVWLFTGAAGRSQQSFIRWEKYPSDLF